MRVKNENITEIKEEISKSEVIVKMKRERKNTNKWEIIFQDRVDFIVKKTMTRVTKTLVFLFSTKTFYIYSEPDGKLENITLQSLNTFFSGINKAPLIIRLKNGDDLTFGNVYTNENKHIVLQMINVANNIPFEIEINGEKILIEPTEDDYNILLSELILMKDYVTLYRRNTIKESIIPMYKRSKKICLYARNKANGLGFKGIIAGSIIPNWKQFKELYDIFGFDNSKIIIDSPFVFSAILGTSDTMFSSGDALPVLKKANIDLKRLAEYLTEDLYPRQCENFADYIDTMRMELDLYDRVKNKYPKNLSIRHRVLVRSVNDRNNYSEYTEKFKDAIENIEKDYSFKGRDYLIKVPAEPQELVIEGTELSHCVAEYVSKVAAGDCLVVFLRKRSEPEKPFFTIEIIGDDITQIEGYQRSVNIPKDVYNFLLRFIKDKGLNIMAPVNVLEGTEKEECMFILPKKEDIA